MSTTSGTKIGIYLDLGEYPSDYAAATSYRRPEGRRWADILEKARLAEALGFDSLWIPDHLIFANDEGRTEGFWECTSMLAALAASTEKVGRTAVDTYAVSTVQEKLGVRGMPTAAFAIEPDIGMALDGSDTAGAHIAEHEATCELGERVPVSG